MVLSVTLLTAQVTNVTLHSYGFKPALKITEKYISRYFALVQVVGTREHLLLPLNLLSVSGKASKMSGKKLVRASRPCYYQVIWKRQEKCSEL